MEVAIAGAAAAIVGSAYYSKKSVDNQKKSIKKANKAAKIQADLDRQSAQLLLREQQRKNKNLLLQQQSNYKAKLGASGLSHKTGSGQVVLDNMQKEHDMEDRYLTSQAKISLAALNNSLNQTIQKNLLDLDTIRAKEKQDALDTFSSAFGAGYGRSLIK